jgi:carboxyl-terminal processing protease
MQGPRGSNVSITVQRSTQEEPIEFEIQRGEVRVETVMGFERKADDSWNFFCDDNNRVGYLRLTAFAQHTPTELQAALEELQRQNMAGLVLDLRFNPGGMLPAAVEVADLFLDEGMIVSAEGRNVPKRVWEAKREGTFAEFPMAILVNRFSASASEIVAACLQDHVRAVIVGDRTWGKGSVQNLVQLEGGRGAIKITTASYHRPSGKNIHRFPDDDEDDPWGVQPTEGYQVSMRSRDQIRWLQWRRVHELAHGTARGPDGQTTTGTDANSAAINNGGRDTKPSDPQLDRSLAYLIEKISGK